MTLVLQDTQPFARGGNRLCFIHPHSPSRCIKVRRPDFTLEDLRRKKGFPKNLRPLASFDDNQEECRVLCRLQKTRGERVFDHLYRCFGFIETDLGPGLETELIRDADGQVSVSLKQYLWQVGYSDDCRNAVTSLTQFWVDQRIPSRDLLTHNVVVQLDGAGGIRRLVAIDGLGSASLVPTDWWPRPVQRYQALRRVQRFEQRIDAYVERCKQGIKPSQVGMLLHRGATKAETSLRQNQIDG